MGRYSYSQPSSSEEYDIDITYLLQEEADLYANEAESRQNIVEPVQWNCQPEDDGIPRLCYCGAVPVIAIAYTSRDPGRRYFTCENVDDGDCHIWKWCDEAVMEELSDFQSQLRMLKNHGYESKQKLEQKVEYLEKTVGELAKKKSGVTNGYPWVVCVMVTVILIGVKAAKAASKRKKSSREEELERLDGILEKKEKITKQKVLERLLARKDPLSEMETSLKMKLMAEML